MVVKKSEQINISAILVIFSLGIILILPALAYGIFDAHDILVHLNWAKHFSKQLWMGEFYPRWLLGMNSGLGSPTFFFYPPIPYYFTSLFYPFRFGNPSIWSPLVLSSTFALILSGLTAYLWLKDLTNQKAALIGSMVYILLPYHWAVDFYWRFAFSEYWSFAWIPLILYFSKKIVIGSPFSVFGFAVSYALLSMTHLPTTLIFSVVPLAYIAFITDRKQRLKVFVRLIFALLLGIGLSAIYLIPALSTQDNVFLKEIAMKPHFYFANNFTWRKQFIYPNFQLFTGYLGILVVLMAVTSYCAFKIARKNPNKTVRQENLYWLIVALASSLMTLPLSKPLWKLVPVLQMIQFPWRFNVVLTVATTALTALAVYSFKRTTTAWYKKISSITVWLLIIIILSGFCMAYYKIERLAFDSKTRQKMSQDAPEYRPKWVSEEIFEQYLVQKLSNNLPKAKITTGKGIVSIENWQPRKIILETNSKTNVKVTLHQLYYPGWTARLDGSKKQLIMEPSQPEGLLRLEIPKGQHKVKITLNAGIKEHLGQAISIVSALILLLLTLPYSKLKYLIPKSRSYINQIRLKKD